MKPYLNYLLATTIIGGMAAPALAQRADTTEPAAGPVEALPANAPDAAGDTGSPIVVTGSRIPQPNLTAVSPVTVLNSQEVKLQGTTRTEDLVNSLPQAFASVGGNLANGATGTATVNLRGLGSARTLVLVNGRRLLPGDPTFPAPDINTIPTAIVERVDVLTGGASSVYGSDAVAGVVNFVMNTNFEGLRLDGQYSFYQHDNRSKTGIVEALQGRGFAYPKGSVTDGGAIDINAVFGAGFDDGRGHITAYAGYRKLDPVTQNRRDYSACASQARTPAQVAAYPGAGSGIPGSPLIFCGGSATSPEGTFFTNVGTFQTSPTGRGFIPGSTPYNFAPTNFYQRADERYTFGAFAEYEISPAVKPYLEVMFMDDRTIAQIAESGAFGQTTNINCDNPLLSPAQLALVCQDANLVRPFDDPATPEDESDAPPIDFVDPVTGNTYNRGVFQILRRNVEGGPRQDDLQHTNFRTLIGVKGDISPAWSYDAYYLYGRVNFAQTYLNEFSATRLTRAVDVVTNPATGAPVCRSVLDGTDPNCIPYDVFARNSVSDAALNYLSIPGFARAVVDQSVASASITGLLGEYGLQFPWANEGLGINVGLEYRKDSVDYRNDAAFQTGDLTGQGAPQLDVQGSFDVRELYAEARLPIVTDGFFHYLAVEGGYRYSKYEIGGGGSFSTDSFKLGLDFSPIRDIRLRASYNRAVRAPNIQELFAPQRVANNGNSDPCAGDFNPDTPQEAPTATAAQCALTGVTAAQYGNIVGNPAGQYSGLIGGNPNLTPEKSDTYSVGVVLQPRFLPGFAATVDYFNIKVKNTISTIGQDTIIQTCIDTANPEFCDLINRDPRGSLWLTPAGFVQDLNTNIGSLKTSGIDVGVSYTTDIGDWGNIGLNFQGTWLDKLVTDNGVSTPYDCTGYYGIQCGTPSPEWRHKARLTYTSPEGIGLSLQWRYFDSVTVDRLSPNPTLNATPTAPFNEKIKAQSYFDLTSTFRIGENYSFRLGVNNILDRAPPIIGSNGTSGVINACPGVFCSGNTFPQVYDAMGRYIFAGVTLDF
ncbi:TonB-dependent receptor domain-containing protein [Allosphingosinicella indica]|uniref:TonB-dependent Receptor Plug Domain n=1 Tax=Allosphingosinicella indica TaxID=941907 RepID=A0A1X7G0V4_9SPHN|nr:TonB-dependent receptor [Allosphingosinicella indica]SMF62019.1 TonB-dependent Receptor Plug Domain [Allosphingosinicella indica]